MSEPVQIERRGAVAIVRMALTHKRNALGPVLVPALADALEQLQRDTQLRALVLSGGTHFCAGGDLGGMDPAPMAMRSGMQMGHRIVRAIAGGPLPVVAAVEGSAYGAGFSMAMACDFVVADDNTRFCAAFGRVGLVPDYGLLWSLPQRAGLGLAREIMMLCEPISGAKAHEWGLVERLSASGKVLDTALELAQRLAQQPPGTLAATKAALSRLPLGLDALLAWEADTQAVLAASEDFQEGVRAFAEKRAPRFSGR